jgi:hypothetical protein
MLLVRSRDVGACLESSEEGAQVSNLNVRRNGKAFFRLRGNAMLAYFLCLRAFTCGLTSMNQEAK